MKRAVRGFVLLDRHWDVLGQLAEQLGELKLDGSPNRSAALRWLLEEIRTGRIDPLKGAA